jgi:hypothetical protein
MVPKCHFPPLLEIMVETWKPFHHWEPENDKCQKCFCEPSMSFGYSKIFIFLFY